MDYSKNQSQKNKKKGRRPAEIKKRRDKNSRNETVKNNDQEFMPHLKKF